MFNFCAQAIVIFLALLNATVKMLQHKVSVLSCCLSPCWNNNTWSEKLHIDMEFKKNMHKSTKKTSV